MVGGGRGSEYILVYERVNSDKDFTTSWKNLPTCVKKFPNTKLCFIKPSLQVHVVICFTISTCCDFTYIYKYPTLFEVCIYVCKSAYQVLPFITCTKCLPYNR
jgi:hypothetical protein